MPVRLFATTATTATTALAVALGAAGVAPTLPAHPEHPAHPIRAAVAATAGDPVPVFVARSAGATEPVTDAAGHVWGARDGLRGVAATSTALVGRDVLGTDDDRIYQVSAVQPSSYSLEVPAPGRYAVRLLLADGYWTAPGQRVFDVTAEGAPAVAGIDIIAEAGRATAHERRFEVQVSDGRLDLGFVPVVDKPLIAGIEVTALDLHWPTGTSVRAVAAHEDVVDRFGRTWTARAGWRGSDRLAWELYGRDVGGTAQDELYRMSRTEPTGWSTPLPDGNYRVTLRMADGYWWKAGQRVFDVAAQGRTVLSRVDVVGAVGRNFAYERTFDVDVRGGRLDLAFVARVDRPLVAAIDVQQIEPLVPLPPGAAPVPFSPDSFFVQRVDQAPLDPRSAEMAANLRQDVVTRYNGVAAVNATHYNVSFVTAPPSQPRVDVAFVDCQSKGYVPWDIHAGEGFFLGVPIPDDAQPAIGDDGELTIYDPATDQLWEFWQARRDAISGQWSACWGGRIDQVSSSLGIFKQGYGVAATGIVMAGGMISLEEARRGSIDHALYLSVPRSQPYPNVSWPALRGDGYVNRPDVVRPGQRVRLDPSVDVASLGLTPVGRMVAVAAQRYGFIVSDTGPSVAVITESGQREKAATGVDPWGALLGMPSHEVLRGFPWDRMQVVQADYGRPVA